MKILNWVEGLWFAAFMAAIQVLLAAGSYVTGCVVFSPYNCGFENGVQWILKHPVFPDLAPKMILVGFVVGLFISPIGVAAASIGAAVPNAAGEFIGRHKCFCRLHWSC